MKKHIGAALLVVFMVPHLTFAAVNPGVEFLSPLVQTIIQLLQDRIAVLSEENRVLKLAKSEPVVCGNTSTLQTPQQRHDELMRLEAQRIRAEYSVKISEVESKITAMEVKLRDPAVSWECGGYGCPFRLQEEAKARKELLALYDQKRALEAERKQSLASVGVFE